MKSRLSNIMTRASGGGIGAVCVLAWLGVWNLPVFAQTPTQQQLEQIQREQQRIIQEQQLRERELLKEQDQRRRPPGTIDLGIEKEGPFKDKSPKCFTNKSIVLEGAYSLSEEERRNLTQPFVGKCIGLAEIRELMRVITNHYIDKGYVTTRVYIPQQDMSTGILKLLVVEGISENFELEDKKSRVSLATAFPGLKGKILNIRDIEQGLDQINRLQSNKATMELRPGKTPGRSTILVKNQPRSPWSGSVALDNHGSESTGKNRGAVTLGYDNLFGLNDYWFTNLSSNTEPDNSKELNQSALLSFNIPYGYWNLTGSYSKSKYVSLVQATGLTFRSSGDTHTYNLGIQHVVARGQTFKTTLSGGLTHKDPKNYIQGVLVTTSSRKLTNLNLDLAGVFSALGGSWTVNGGFTKGIDWLGIEELPGAGTGTVPTAKFLKFNASTTYATPFKIQDHNASWSSSLQFQYSQDYLYGSEQISIGGLHTVRGYDGTSISGDQGIYWRNDLAVTLSSPTDPFWASWAGAVQPYWVLDAGSIFGRSGQRPGNLMGTAIGLRTIGGRVKFDLAYGVPVLYSGLRGASLEDHALYVSLTITL